MSKEQQDNNEQQSKEADLSDGISGQRLNLIIALCAIFISAASFYATYLQADAAERQVKAMTSPLIQFKTSNWDNEQKKSAVILSLQNAGVGPAIIKTVIFKYKDKQFNRLSDYYKACCDKEYASYKKISENNEKNNIAESAQYLTTGLQNNIILGQNQLNFVRLTLATDTEAFWQKLNIERRSLSLAVCYCSLLGECYTTEKSGIIEEVAYCPLTN